MFSKLNLTKTGRLVVLVLAFCCLTVVAGAQVPAEPVDYAKFQQQELLQGLNLVFYLIAIAIVLLVFAVMLIVDYMLRERYNIRLLPKFQIPLPFFGLGRILGTKVSAKKAKSFDQDLGHAYDGIRELDNGAPPIFNYIFYGTIVFGVIYMAYFFLMDGTDQYQDYAMEVQQAETQLAEYRARNANNVDENSITMTQDASFIEAGHQIYTENCAACHGQNAEGVTGPNLSDQFWIHGGGIKNVFKTVKYGMPAKGMISWQTQLSPQQMAQVASYVWSLQGHPANGGRGPEGDPYQEGTDSTATPQPDTTAAITAR